MPRRWIDPSFFTDEKLAKASLEERHLFAAMIANQDDDGRLLGHPGYLRSIAFPYDDFTIEEVKQMRDHLAEVNPNVTVYENAGSEYIQLKKYYRYQRPRYPQPSKYPPPPGWKPVPRQTPVAVPESRLQEQVEEALCSGRLLLNDLKVSKVREQFRVGNSYIDMLAEDCRGNLHILEFKKAALSNQHREQVVNYGVKLTERVNLTKEPSKTLIGPALAPNFDPEEAAKARVNVLTYDRDMKLKQVVNATVTFTGNITGNITVTPQIGRGWEGKGKGLDLGLGKDSNSHSPIAPLSQDSDESAVPTETAGEVLANRNSAKERQKPKQVETAVFLDMVEKQIGVSLGERPKLMGRIRPLLVNNPGATPERLLECFLWLKENDNFCKSRDSPTVISTMPSKYPEWAAGKLSAPSRKEEHGKHGEQRQHSIPYSEPYRWRQASDDFDDTS